MIANFNRPFWKPRSIQYEATAPFKVVNLEGGEEVLLPLELVVLEGKSILSIFLGRKALRITAGQKGAMYSDQSSLRTSDNPSRLASATYCEAGTHAGR